RAKTLLAHEFAAFKRFEQDLAAKEKLLDAQQQFVAASLDQLEKMVTAKRELEVRLEQLEADEAWIAANAVVTPLKTDNKRVAEIKNALDRIETSQTVEKEKQALVAHYGNRIGDAPAGAAPAVNTSEIQNYLNGTPQPAST